LGIKELRGGRKYSLVWPKRTKKIQTGIILNKNERLRYLVLDSKKTNDIGIQQEYDFPPHFSGHVFLTGAFSIGFLERASNGAGVFLQQGFPYVFITFDSFLTFESFKVRIDT